MISKRAGKRPAVGDESVLLLTVHAANLFTVLVGLVCRGEFDVASYLYRGLGDVGGLVYACGRDEALAGKWLEGNLKASEARKRLVADFRSEGDDDLAEWANERFLDDADAMNELAHAKRLHGDKLIENDGGSLRPALGGHRDDEQYALMTLAALEQENWFLTLLHGVRGEWLGDDWFKRYDTARAKYLKLPGMRMRDDVEGSR